MSETIASANGRIEFSEQIDLKSFFILSLITGFFTIITLGGYAPWGFTKIVRRLAASVRVNEEPLEYVGRGLHLFLGSLALVVVVYAPVGILVTSVGRTGAATGLAPVFGLWMLAILFLFGAVAFVLYRYLASRTLWRGARLDLGGSPLGFAARLFGYMLLSLVTVGWFFPTACRRLVGYFYSHLKFGGSPFAFDADGARQVRIYPAFALLWAVAATFGLLRIGVALGAGRNAAEGIGLIAALISTVANQPYHAAFARSATAGVVFDDARFSSGARAGPLIGLSLQCLVLIVFSLGLLIPLVMALWVRFYIRRLSSTGEVDLDAIARSSRADAKAPGLTALLRLA
jgi:uncharacterized membrane protein YjgN (DUF898 family)